MMVVVGEVLKPTVGRRWLTASDVGQGDGAGPDCEWAEQTGEAE